MTKQTITINGRIYDRLSGMPLSDAPIHSPVKKSAPVSHAKTVHTPLQRSRTLNRQYVARSAPKSAAVAEKTPAPSETPAPASSSEAIKVHHKISRFHPVEPATKPVAKPTSQPSADIGPTVHPIQARIHKARATTPSVHTKAVHKPSDVIKREAIADALDQAPTHTESKSTRHRDKPKKSRRNSVFQRRFSFAATSLAAVMVVGYVTYLSMPDISVRVAAAQAGINAGLPDYKPSGYSLKGPIAFDDGEVTLSYAANGSPQYFDLTQERTGWDSSALLDYYVQPSAGDNYTIMRESGLTVYSWDNQAAWVNNGIFYSIDGDATLSLDQIRRMAVSI
jgi:hypothetical protein